MEKNHLRDAGRLSSLTFMIAGCLGYAIEDMQTYLDNHNLVMKGRDKHLFNQLKPLLKRVQFLLNDLEKEAFKVMATDEDPDNATLSYEDATHIYWYLFLLMVDRGGTDNLYDLRLMAFADMIAKYKSQLNLPIMNTARFMAFNQVDKAMREGKYPKEILKNLIHEDENKSETFEGKISEQHINY